MSLMNNKLIGTTILLSCPSYTRNIKRTRTQDKRYCNNLFYFFLRLTIPDQAVQPTPVRPVDNILASLLRNFKNLVYKYHEHDSLLENNSAEDLNEQEKADAWDAYEKDVSMKSEFLFGSFNCFHFLN